MSMPTMSARCSSSPSASAPRRKLTASPHAGWRAGNYVVRPAPLTRLLDEGDRIELGDRTFTVLRLPGHSCGCIGLFDERDGMLFSGDAIYDSHLIDDMWCSNRQDYRATMRRLIDLPARTVHGGHGESFGRDRMVEISRAYLERTQI